MYKKVLVVSLILLTISGALFAGTTGKLAGVVKDSNDEPVPFANVVLAGTQIGDQADDNGKYFIINIPPGKYTVTCSQMGYQSQEVTGVKISLDLTEILNFQLDRKSAKIEGVKTTAAAVKHVKLTSATSGNEMTSANMEDFAAVEDIQDILAIQAGATVTNGELHVRGGRANEVVYTVDGLSVSDPVDGGAALSLDTDAIDLLVPMFGGFPAEYGNAQSGMVSIVTKNGTSQYSGKYEMKSDHLVLENNSNSDEVKFAIGGPVLTPFVSGMKDRFTFYFNSAGNWHDSRYKDYYEADLDNLIATEHLDGSWNGYEIYNPYAGRDNVWGFDVGDRNYNLINMNLKTKFDINELQKVTFAARGDRSIYEPYSHGWKYALEHYTHIETSSQQYITTYNHLFSSVMNLNVKASYYHKSRLQGPKGVDKDSYFTMNDHFDYYALENGLNDTAVDPLTVDGTIGEAAENNLGWTYISATGESTTLPFVYPGSIEGTNIDDENSILTLRTDFDYQINDIHGFKTGFELIKHDIRKDRLSNPWVIDLFRYNEYLQTCTPDTSYFVGDNIIDEIEGSPTEGDTLYFDIQEDIDFYTQEDLYAATLAASGTTDGYEASPYQAAFYLQDKMEWEGMIVSAGLRVDFWYLGGKYRILRDGGTYTWENFDKADRFQMMLSPRLGISHPISETSVLHFAYNYQNQLPQMQYIFTTASPEDAITGNSNITVGEPNLEPQITVTYEVGLQKQLSENYVIDVTTYFKNIYNYVSTQKVYMEGDETISWYEYISQDYGSARGLDINIQRMFSSFISGSTSYSLSWAEGNNSATVVQDENQNLREFPLDWDMRHNFNFSLTFRVPYTEEFSIPFTDIIVPTVITNDLSVSFLYTIASGTPYTPQNEDGRALDTNSALQPYTENANLGVTKKIRFSKKTYLKVYMDINNLFDKKNINSVFPMTGSPTDTGEELWDDNDPLQFVDPKEEYLYNLSVADPGIFSNGRKLTVGMSFHF